VKNKTHAGARAHRNPGHDCPPGADQQAALDFPVPAEPLVRSIRIPIWRRLLSEAGLELRVVPSAPLLVLGGDIPGLVAVTPASAAAAKFAYATTADLGTVSGIQSAAYAINDNSQRLAGHTPSGSPSTTPPRSNENGEIVASGSRPEARSTRSCSPSLCPRPGPTRPPDSRRTERPAAGAGIAQTI